MALLKKGWTYLLLLFAKVLIGNLRREKSIKLYQTFEIKYKCFSRIFYFVLFFTVSRKLS